MQLSMRCQKGVKSHPANCTKGYHQKEIIGRIRCMIGTRTSNDYGIKPLGIIDKISATDAPTTINHKLT